MSRGVRLADLPPKMRKQMQAALRDAEYLKREKFIRYCMAGGVPAPEPEHRFDPARRWRLDWAWPDQRLALEVEGGVWTQGRHTRGAGFIADMEKYNALAVAGWRLLRITPEQLYEGPTLDLIRRAIRKQ